VREHEVAQDIDHDMTGERSKQSDAQQQDCGLESFHARLYFAGGA
jgi:hypothetical protein